MARNSRNVMNAAKKSAEGKRAARLTREHNAGVHAGTPIIACPLCNAVDALHASHTDALHVAAVKVTNAVEDRDDAIRQATLDGVPATKIAAAVGLTRQRVWQIATAAN